jgi:hypothetical protein
MSPKMTDINDLASMFSDINLHDVTNSHILEIEFPVSELLSNSHQVPHLDPPASLETREAPPHDQRRAGVTQSVCRLCHKITEYGPNPHRENYDWAARRKLAFGHLAYGPAKSLLRAVAFHDGDLGEDRLRLLFYVQYYEAAGPRGRYSYRYDVELSQNQWDAIVRGESELEGVGGGEDCKWVKALEELITRSSDRAYHHVRNRLAADYSPEAAAEEEASWGEEWGGMRLRGEEVEDEKRAMVDEIGLLMRECELERPNAKVDQLGRMLKDIQI